MVDQNPCAVCFQRSICLVGSLNAGAFPAKSQAIDESHQIAQAKYRVGEYLFRFSDPLEYLYVILTGSAKSCCLDTNGQEQIVALHIPGDLVGLDAAIDGVHASSGIALDECFVCKIPCSFFDESFSVAQRLRFKLIRQAAQALRAENFYSSYIRKKTAEQRLAIFLLDLSHRLKSRGYRSDQLFLSLPRRDIGNYLGLSMETVSRTFSRLQDIGLIRVHHRQVVIHDREQLESIARGTLSTGHGTG
ncbi:MAG: Crp/Fnr family transcriptional regulator [Gammaproteobacteria bacterium]